MFPLIFFSLTGDLEDVAKDAADRDYDSDNSDCDSVATFSSGELTLFDDKVLNQDKLKTVIEVYV